MLSSPLPECMRAEAYTVAGLENEIAAAQIEIDYRKNDDWDHARTLVSKKIGLRVALNLKLGKAWNDGFTIRNARGA